ncbi:hypothetical protein [Brevibacterium atlanticum]|uniref:hypothetical protein n=1 Tax=Brevibacterium atlanticum TaxID=2697563 RepID=UPI0014243F8A|nr:hypothetical protein [Brevibacterium atlanticum]
MRLRPLALLSAAVLLATTTACVSTPEETRPQERPSVSKEEVTPIETPKDAPKVTVVDSSPGGKKDTDPLWQGLAEAAEKKTPAYLKVYVHTGNPEVPDSGEMTVTADSPDSVSVTVDAENVDDDLSPFLLIHGTFDVDEIGNSAYTLKTVDDEDIAELDPKGPDDEKRCTAEDAQDRIGLAADDLADDPDRREEFRQQWGGSPRVWWGIQMTAISLGEEGGVAGDYLTEACGDYLQ